MQNFKVCFVGVGSIAKRHIRNLRTVCKERGMNLYIDVFRRNDSLDIINDIDDIGKTYFFVKEMPDDYDAVFITNPTKMHFDTLKMFHMKGRNFFIEKPVVSLDHIEAAKMFETRSDTVYYVACPLRYNAVIQYVKNNVNPQDVISVRCISSSYLPDWRLDQDYRKSYSAHKELGGGVSIDLIHEWDYLTYLFGNPKQVLHLIGKKSDLEIDSDDYAVYIAEYEDKIVELHLDYFGKKPIREIQLITKDDNITGNIIDSSVSYEVSGEKIRFHEERDDYQRRELNYFLDMILGEKSVENGYLHAIEILELTQGRLNGVWH